MSKRISVIESELNVKLPHEYALFINDKGYLQINGSEIYGYREDFIDISKIPCVIGATKLYRDDYNIPDTFIVISDTGYEGWIVCLDTKDGKVFELNGHGKKKLVANSFNNWLNKLQTT